MSEEVKRLGNLITIGINLVILGLCLKLYTEYFKDRSISGRAK